MGSAFNCPSGKAGHCPLYENGRCYAMKAERLYPQVKPYRDRQENYWLNNNANTIIADIKKALNRHKKIRYIRFNEAGDFHGQKCVEKLNKIGKALKDINIYTYTHNPDLNYEGLSDNITVNGSGFMVHNNFNTVTKLNGNRITCGGDCRSCKICMKRRNVKIDCLMH